MILYKGEPKNSTKRSLEFIRKFDKVRGNKINTQKPIGFLGITISLVEKELRMSVPFKIALKM